jgi:crossover junction endodeoxyribonuclease RuvC
VPSSPIRILGIDPGSHRLGIACLEKRGQTIRLLFAETIEASRHRDRLHTRLGEILKQLRKRLDELVPHEVAVEDIFFGKNQRSAFDLGVTRGAAIGFCLERGIEIFEYAPARVKLVVTGHGRADKIQVQKMVAMTLGIPLQLGFDATDAIAVALCHASMRKLPEV